MRSQKGSIEFQLRLSLIFVIGIALLKTGSWFGLLLYIFIALVWVIFLNPPLKTLTKVLGIELILLSLLALPMGGEKALFLFTRSWLCLLIMNSFLITLPPHHLGIALKSLPLPSNLQEIVLLTGQYLEILISEINRMQRSAKLRGLSGPTGWLRYTNIAMIGTLYLRSLDRAERVYQAMLVRGYQGKFPLTYSRNQRENQAILIAIILGSSLTIFSYYSF